MAKSVWIKIRKTGPLLEAAAPQLEALRATRPAANTYRIGEERRVDGAREVEIIFDEDGGAYCSPLAVLPARQRLERVDPPGQ